MGPCQDFVQIRPRRLQPGPWLSAASLQHAHSSLRSVASVPVRLARSPECAHPLAQPSFHGWPPRAAGSQAALSAHPQVCAHRCPARTGLGVDCLLGAGLPSKKEAIPSRHSEPCPSHPWRDCADVRVLRRAARASLYRLGEGVLGFLLMFPLGSCSGIAPSAPLDRHGKSFTTRWESVWPASAASFCYLSRVPKSSLKFRPGLVCLFSLYSFLF